LNGAAVKILIPVDGSAYTKRALAYLVAHDEWLGAAHRYTVLHVSSPLPGRAAAALDRQQVEDYYLSTSEQVFKPIRTFLDRHGIDATFVAKVGDPAETIARLADGRKFDLLVMGSHGHGNLGNLVLGSVATKVLAGCKVAVLVVR
jgi:nucleotide-binding universal stress UspA family protein